MKRFDRPTWIVFGLVTLVAFSWAAYSDQAWEDYYITFRASQNLADGHGLTFTPGERVHSFTSPLGVLLPAATYLLTGKASPVAALWLFRVFSIAALAGAATLLWISIRRLGLGALAGGFLVTALAFDSKSVSFSINGMETGLLLFFAAWTLWAVFTRPARLSLHLGIAWAGLMWTRPDACVYIAALATGLLIFVPGETAARAMDRRRLWLRRILIAAAICTVLYLPWFVWAWSYYGSPVPHTVIAKSGYNRLNLEWIFGILWDFPVALVTGRATLPGVFLPSYGITSDWPTWLPTATGLLAALPLPVFLLPFVRREARVTSFVYLVGQFYLTEFVGGAVPWYMPIVTFFGLFTLALCLGQALPVLHRWRQREGTWRRRALTGQVACALIAGSLILGGALLTVLMCRQARVEMAISEYRVRKPIGEWLHQHAATPRDTVFLECLGFIGYFSQLKMLDFPGLSSPEVVDALRRSPDHTYLVNWQWVIRDLQPDWLVLRPHEEETIRRHDPTLLTEGYTLAKAFDERPALAATSWVPLRGFVEFNTRFNIFQRVPPVLPTTLPLPLTLDSFTRKEAFGGTVGRNGPAFTTHAPAHLEVPVPPAALQFVGQLGMFEGAYVDAKPTPTDGVTFIFRLLPSAGGTPLVLLQWDLDPADLAADRGDQAFILDLPPDFHGTLEIVVGSGPADRNAFDWAYLRDLAFIVPRETLD